MAEKSDGLARVDDGLMCSNRWSRLNLDLHLNCPLYADSRDSNASSCFPPGREFCCRSNPFLPKPVHYLRFPGPISLGLINYSFIRGSLSARRSAIRVQLIMFFIRQWAIEIGVSKEAGDNGPFRPRYPPFVRIVHVN